MGQRASKNIKIENGRKCSCGPKVHCCQRERCIASVGSMIELDPIQGFNE